MLVGEWMVPVLEWFQKGCALYTPFPQDVTLHKSIAFFDNSSSVMTVGTARQWGHKEGVTGES